MITASEAGRRGAEKTNKLLTKEQRQKAAKKAWRNKDKIRARLTIYGHAEMSDKEFEFFKEWLTKVVPGTAKNKRGELSSTFRQTLYKQ